MQEKTKPLDGQAALVTGASSGIGRAIAELFGASGAKVAVNFRSDQQGADATVETIARAGGEAFTHGADVSEEAQVSDLFAAAVERFGTLDIVVANAGLQRDAPVEAMTLADWRKVIDVNLTGQFLCARAAIGEFRRRGRAGDSKALGKLICMSSVHEIIPWAGHVNYAASKGGVQMMMKSIAQEVARHGIRVNGIAPGAIRTDINQDAWSTPEAEAKLLELIPYGRIGEGQDVARAALWLASDESDYLTGTTLVVDGGMTLYPAFHAAG